MDGACGAYRDVLAASLARDPDRRNQRHAAGAHCAQWRVAPLTRGARVSLRRPVSRVPAAGRRKSVPGGSARNVLLRDGELLVLVEVRSRSRADFGGAAASIGRGKQRRFVLAAKHLLLAHPEFRRLRVRIDVVAIDPAPQPGDPPVITWIRNAFAAG